MSIDTSAEIQWIHKKAGGRRIGGAPSERLAAAIALHKGGANASPQTAVTLYEPLMKRIRALAGDRVAVGMARGCLVLKRVQSGGWALSPSAQTKAEREAKLGKPVMSVVKMTSPVPGVEYGKRIEFDLDDITITDDGAVWLRIGA